MDAVYDPPETRLLRDAASRGARTISGKWMLVYQAAEQLQLWTGMDAPIERMAEAFRNDAGDGFDSFTSPVSPDGARPAPEGSAG